MDSETIAMFCSASIYNNFFASKSEHFVARQKRRHTNGLLVGCWLRAPLTLLLDNMRAVLLEKSFVELKKTADYR